MPTTPFLLKVPDDILARLRAAAAARGVSVASLLLEPWRGGEAVPVVAPTPPLRPRSATVVVSPKRRIAVTVKASDERPLVIRLKGQWKAP